VWCDTPYASWSPEGQTVSIDDIYCEVQRHGIEHVVITGGEPMLFEPVEELCALLKINGHLITIETAGTVFRDLPCDLMSISPKLSNSTPGGEWMERHEATRSDLRPLQTLVRRYAHQLKFVVNPEEDLEGQLAEIEGVLAAAYGEQAAGADILRVPLRITEKVLLMAEGTDSETLTRRERMLAPICTKLGYRLSPRLHIHLFGNTRST